MANMVAAIAITLDADHEGGFQKMPNDRANWTGGEVGVGTLVGTKYGITTLDMPGVDIENITLAQAAAYYMEHYVKPLYSQIDSQSIGAKLFDMGVLFGVGTAIENLQRVLDVGVDGNFGQITLNALNASNDTLTLEDFKEAMVQHAEAIAAKNPNDAGDLPDWIRRINS